MAALNTTDFMSIFSDGIPQFLDILPPVIRERLQTSGELESLIEVVLDYGRPAEARYRNKVERFGGVVISELDIEFVIKMVGEFSLDNRAGIERTLHRISCIRNRQGKIVGLTCRVGRAMEGTIDLIDDIVRSGQSILLLGRPGIGKTTKLREVARVLADEVGRRVVIIDTSNEIAGDGDVPHPAIGHARRMQVSNPLEQHQVMIEAVENHMPEVIIIDEIGTESEAGAARTIAERGVQLIATAHGQTLENLMLNPTLCDLVGGIQSVTLSDDEARRRGTQKTVLERKAPPTFDVVIELLDFERLAVHGNVMKTVDNILRGLPPRPEIRVRSGEGTVEVVQSEQTDHQTGSYGEDYPTLARRPALPDSSSNSSKADKERSKLTRATAPQVVRIFPYGLQRHRLERAIREKKVAAVIAPDVQSADAVIAIRSTYQNNPAKLKDPNNSMPVVVVKSNTYSQISSALDEAVKSVRQGASSQHEISDEVAKAVQQVVQTGKPIELRPQDARTRRIQLQMVASHQHRAESVGEEPGRRVRILPGRLNP